MRHWRTYYVETPTPANAGESSHFGYWLEQMASTYSEFNPTGPIESLRPCLLPLLAPRLVGQFNHLAHGNHYTDYHELAASFFFSNQVRTTAHAPLGDLPGIIVEMHNGCDEAAFGPSSEEIAAGA